MTTIGTGLASSELASMHKIGTEFTSQIETTAEEVVKFEEFLHRMTQGLKGARERARTIEAHLQNLTQLKETLCIERDNLEKQCGQHLGKFLTTQSSMQEIRQTLSEMAILLGKVASTIPHDVGGGETTTATAPSKDGSNLLGAELPRIENFDCPPAPQVSLTALGNILLQLKKYSLAECTNLIQQGVAISRDLVEQFGQLEALQKRVEGLRSECKEINRMYEDNYMLSRALEGDTNFLSCPNIHQQAFEMLTTALQNTGGLMRSVSGRTSGH
ncbi:hypothetical protein Pelo_13294 [Pelomyxa schiedti]|nr:hypothetical protein Pelo_13294 [Pelomyxa schiedti]